MLLRLAPYAIITAALASALWFFADYVRDQEHSQRRTPDYNSPKPKPPLHALKRSHASTEHICNKQKRKPNAGKNSPMISNLWRAAMRPYLIFCALLLSACTAREKPPPQILAPPIIPADLLRPCPGYRGPIPRNEGQLIDAVVAEKQGRA